MTKKNQIQLFDKNKIRTVWDNDTEEWYFSVIDVVEILTDSPDAKRYWSVLKSRLKKEGVEPTTICSTLKLPAADGKMRMTDVATCEQLFRIIQSLPSPKAEPFKQWMAEVAATRIMRLQTKYNMIA
ncbi:MAG: Bro-N domain-containing protein [Muribaculaceae bacterium]|nr:Bro-N domain-containing protein [Muribaculaceae bacterium]